MSFKIFVKAEKLFLQLINNYFIFKFNMKFLFVTLDEFLKYFLNIYDGLNRANIVMRFFK